MAPPARVLGYIRVSSDEQASSGTSLDGQRDTVRRWCADRGWPEPDIRVEVESAGEEKIERRIEIHRLIADARSGDVVVVAFLDRWSRDVPWGVGSIRGLVRRGVGWFAIHDQIDASTPNGDEQLGLKLWFAESERRRIKVRTVGRKRALAAQGLWSDSRVPFGYQRGSRAQRRQLHLEPHPEDAEVRRELLRRCVAGHSTRDLSRWLAAQPRAPKGLAAAARLLRDPVVLGRMPDGSPGLHPPIVEQALWDRAQRVLEERRLGGPAPRVTSKTLMLAGVLRCAMCGRRCTVAVGERRASGEAPDYYVCAGRRRGEECPARYVLATALELAADADVKSRISILRSQILTAVADVPEEPRQDFAALRARLEAKRQRAISLAVDGTITTAQLAEQQARLDREAGELARREEARRTSPTPAERARVSAALDALDNAWEEMTIDARREAVGLLAERASLAIDGALRWEWREWGEL